MSGICINGDFGKASILFLEEELPGRKFSFFDGARRKFLFPVFYVGFSDSFCAAEFCCPLIFLFYCSFGVGTRKINFWIFNPKQLFIFQIRIGDKSKAWPGSTRTIICPFVSVIGNLFTLAIVFICSHVGAFPNALFSNPQTVSPLFSI